MVVSIPRPPNYPIILIYPKYPLLRAIRALLKGPWGVLARIHSRDFNIWASGASKFGQLHVWVRLWGTFRVRVNTGPTSIVYYNGFKEQVHRIRFAVTKPLALR